MNNFLCAQSYTICNLLQIEPCWNLLQIEIVLEILMSSNFINMSLKFWKGVIYFKVLIASTHANFKLT